MSLPHCDPYLIGLLETARQQYEVSKSTRLRVVRIAKAYGYTNKQIGDLIGMTEAGVRQMLKRAVK